MMAISQEERWRIRHHLPDELMWEILTWLPVKSLMRFRCVSKHWRSIIRNPSFVNSYRGGFKGLLIQEPGNYIQRFSPTENFFYINLLDDDGPDDRSNKQISLHHTLEHGNGHSLDSTRVVNGLVCYYCGNYSCLYNIATRERIDLPLSQYEYNLSRYHLGYDPINKMYKLLKICPPVYDSEALLIRNFDCEILTLGIDESWRNIESPPCEILKNSICFDGVLYWMEPENNIAFDLAREKFGFFTTPGKDYIGYLPQFGPSLATLGGTILKTDMNSGKMTCFGVMNRYDGKNGGWQKEHSFILQLKDEFDDCEGFRFPLGMLPDGKVVVICEGTQFWNFQSPLYLYDQVEKKLTRFVIRSSSSRSDELIFQGCMSSMTYHEENIIPLNCLTATASPLNNS
ncbi:hypothetical protein ACH5RR_022719 [Cinchona calisaya]|uniref:F-box domain-containing protein n=1 Tax=Cinchona calisaya TaxID=153742 RepID=A0ABD2Z8L1_9GENT